MFCANPMQCSFHVNARSIRTAFAFRNIGTVQFDNFPGAVFYNFITLNDVCTFQANHLAGRETEIFLGGNLHEVLFLNQNLTTKRNFARSAIGVLRVVLTFQHFNLSFRVIRDHHFDRIKHYHPALRDFVQVFTHTKFQQANINQVFTLGNANAVAKFPNAGGGIASPTNAT